MIHIEGSPAGLPPVAHKVGIWKANAILALLPGSGTGTCCL